MSSTAVRTPSTVGVLPLVEDAKTGEDVAEGEGGLVDDAEPAGDGAALDPTTPLAAFLSALFVGTAAFASFAAAAEESSCQSPSNSIFYRLSISLFNLSSSAFLLPSANPARAVPSLAAMTMSSGDGPSKAADEAVVKVLKDVLGKLEDVWG